VDGKDHQVAIDLDCDPVIAVDTPDQAVVWSRVQTQRLNLLSVGSQDQRVLGRSGDNLRIDWGHFYLAVPKDENAATSNSRDSLQTFVRSGKLPGADDLDMPSTAGHAAHLAAVFPLTVGSSAPQTRHVLVAYAEGLAIEYLNRRLKPYWQRDGMSTAEMLDLAESQREELDKQGTTFDGELATDLRGIGGDSYAQLGTLAFRQTLAAHGFVADLDGAPLMFPKENFSNGCIGTVDVLYPSAPFFLFFNPALLEAQIKPVLEYSALPRWRWPFAPHDLGTYPLADGQVYGGGERTEENQMPVEESGNLLILLDALGHAENNDWHLAQQYWPQLTKWAEYLRSKGLDPENQLSTDDFAGHLAHNANLSIKAIEGLAAYAQMAEALGRKQVAHEYESAAHEMAKQWEGLAIDGDHYKLAFDKAGTWSQKYNLVWDGMLGLKLFPPRVRETEWKFYLQHINRFGLPLDNRETYTKLDWEIWTGTLTENRADFDKLMGAIGTWINEGPTRVPLTDWYDTLSGKQIGFQARSVVGGVYMKALAKEDLARKWRTAKE
jgi:hypothetical protein